MPGQVLYHQCLQNPTTHKAKTVYVQILYREQLCDINYSFYQKHIEYFSKIIKRPIMFCNENYTKTPSSHLKICMLAFKKMYFLLL